MLTIGSFNYTIITTWFSVVNMNIIDFFVFKDLIELTPQVLSFYDRSRFHNTVFVIPTQRKQPVI